MKPDYVLWIVDCLPSVSLQDRFCSIPLHMAFIVLIGSFENKGGKSIECMNIYVYVQSIIWFLWCEYWLTTMNMVPLMWKLVDNYEYGHSDVNIGWPLWIWSLWCEYWLTSMNMVTLMWKLVDLYEYGHSDVKIGWPLWIWSLWCEFSLTSMNMVTLMWKLVDLYEYGHSDVRIGWPLWIWSLWCEFSLTIMNMMRLMLLQYLINFVFLVALYWNLLNIAKSLSCDQLFWICTVCQII